MTSVDLAHNSRAADKEFMQVDYFIREFSLILE